MPVEPITDENTFPDKAGLRPVPTNKNPANYIRGVDINKLKARLKDHAELLNALEELIGEGVDTSAITSPDTSVSLTATDDGLVLEGAEDLVAPTHGLGVDADGAVGRVPLVPTAVSEALDDIEDELADLDARMDDAEAEITTVSGVASAAASAAGAAQTTANNALPKPGGTTTVDGIATGSGNTGAAVAVSTTTLADLVKRLGNVFTLSANTVLTDAHSGSVIFVDTTAGARTLTIPPTLAAGWNAVIVREGVNTLNIVGSTVLTDTMLMKGPAAVANAVAIAVDDGGVSVLKRSATKCWCAGKVS